MNNKIINSYIGLIIDCINSFGHLCRGSQKPEEYYGEEIKVIEDYLNLDWDTIQELYFDNKWGE